MRDLQQILAEARLLPPEDRRRLIDALEELSMAQGAEDIPAGPYAHSLAAAASVDSAFCDVSADKYQHLAEAYASTDDRR
jgi:hypothetical protein